MSRKWLLNAAFILVALVVTGLAARHFAGTGWPLRHANVWLVSLSALIFLVSYFAKAWGWQHLFRRGEKPAMLTLAAAGGAACVGGIALPGRFDEVLRVAVVRRCRRKRASIKAVALSLFVLGLLDSVALTPFASAAAVVSGLGGWLQAGMIVVAVAGVAAAGLVLALPRLARVTWLARFRVVGWLGEHAAEPRQAAWAWLGVALSWTLRATAIFVLLAALGMGASFALALAFVCGSAASAVLPIAPAGAATQVGAGAGVLVASGVHAEQAIAFGIAAQGLVILVGAVFLLALAAWHAQGRVLAARGRLTAA